MLTSSALNNSKVQVSIAEIDNRTYIIYMKSVGMFKCYLEDFETKKRAISDTFDNHTDAVEDAWNKIIKE